jgi:hypothetical protein
MLREGLCTVFIISRSVLLRKRKFKKNYFLLRKSCGLLDKVEKCGRAGQTTDGNIMWRTRIACWLIKATETHPEYVILIAFPLQQ